MKKEYITFSIRISAAENKRIEKLLRKAPVKNKSELLRMLINAGLDVEEIKL